MATSRMPASLKTGLRYRRATSLDQDFYPEGMPEEWRNNYLVLLTGAIWITEDDPDVMDALAAAAEAPKPVLSVLQSVQAETPPVFSDWLQAHPEQPVIVRAPEEPIWQPNVARANEAAGCRIGLIPAQDQPKILRAWLEAFAAQAPELDCALFIDGDRPSVATLDRVQTLLELMGW